MAYKTVKVILLLAGTTVGLVLSIDLTWVEAMEACVNNDQAPFDPDRNYKPDKKWTGTVKYNSSYGIVTLQVEKTEDGREKHCSAFILPLLNATILWNVTKCTLADFNIVSIKDLPTPTHCMMNQGNSSQYVSCDEEIDDGCQPIDKGSFSQLRITLSFTNARDEYCKDEPCRAVNQEDFCLTSLIIQYKYYLIVFGSLVVILDVACICCCLSCQTRIQLLSREKDIVQEPVHRPYSEAIERIYINRDVSNQSDTDEVVTKNTQRTEARLRIVQQNMQNYDMAVSRSTKSQSGDYDLARPGTGWCTTVTSPDVNYAHVEMMNKQTMDTVVPEDEIYSKRKLVWEDGNDATNQPSLDVQTKMKYSIVAENNHKKVTTGGIKRVEIAGSKTLVVAPYTTVVNLDQTQQVQKVGYNKADDDIYSPVNMNGTKQQIKEEETRRKSEKPLQSINSVDNSSCMKKPTEANVKALDKLTKIKRTQDKTPPKASEGTTNEKRFKIDKTNTMTEKNAAVLIGKVRLETKL